MKECILKRILLILGLLLASYVALPFSSNGYTIPISIKSGLNNNTVYDIYYGENDFVWFSTDMGISRYDGFRVRNYPLLFNKDENSRISVSRAVKSIVQGLDGLLFLQLIKGGMACFDPLQEKYLSLKFPSLFNSTNIISLYVANDNDFFIGTTEGLYRASAKRSVEKGEESIVFDVLKEPLMNGEISLLTGMGKDWVFACVNENQVMTYDIKMRKLERLKRREERKVTALYVHENYLWICPASSEIELYNIKEKTSHSIHGMGECCNLFLNTYVTDIVDAGGTNFFVATWNGLFLLKFSSKALTEASCSLTYLDKPDASGMGRKITQLKWHDKQKILWIATFGEGAYQMYRMEKTFYFLEQPFNEEISSIEEDRKGYVWILTEKGKLWKSEFRHFAGKTPFKRWTEGLNPDESYKMYKDKQGSLWLGGSKGDLLSINPSTDEMTSFKLNPKGIAHFSEAIHQFCLDSRDRFWLVTDNNLVLLDYKTGESSVIPLKYEGKRIRKINAIAEDKEGNLWVGTNMGLKRMDIQGQAIRLSGKYEESVGLDASPVSYIYVNSYNQILASYSDKVLRIDGREKDKVDAVFTLLNGLSSSRIYCMVDDENGNTWVGSNSGIMTIRNDRDLLYNYASFGYSNVVCRLRDGRLVWASSLGLTFFDPIIVKNERAKNNLQLVEVWVKGDPVSVGQKVKGELILKKLPGLQHKFVFGVMNNDFTFYFSDLEYGVMDRQQAYRLLPDQEWKVGAMKGGITFRDLPTGSYTLQVKLIYPDATESAVWEMPIRIQNYWWGTIGAKLGYLLVILASVILVYFYLEQKAKRRDMHKAREVELREKLNVSKLKQEQKQEFDLMRNQLLTKFTEELRTPLSLIIAPLKEMSKIKNLPAGIVPKLQVAYRNSLGMLDACNQLLGIYTQGSLAEKLKVAPYTVERVVDKVTFSINELVRINQIDFKCDKRIKKDLEIWVDRKRMSFVLHNLLSNALNHVNFSGVVRLLLQEIIRDGVRYCVITVEDNGKDRVRGVADAESNGLPLNLSSVELGYDVMERIVKLHHGRMSLKSLEGEGTEVVVEIPVGKEVFQNDPNVVFVDPDPQEESDDTVHREEEQLQDVPIPEDTLMHMNAETASVPKEKKRLLIVEDHKDIRLYLKVLFAQEYDLLIAVNGQEGIDVAVQEHPDLILCDIMMPVKDGFECCRELKERLDTCHIPFIMLTAKVEDEDVIQGLELGADDYILKPFTPSILKAKVRNLISGRISLKQMYAKLLMSPDKDSTEAVEVEEEKKMEDPFISSVVKIIEENICEEDFNVKKLASELNMSQPTLYRKVKQSTDFTIIELIRGVRMCRAAVLLKQKIYAVQEVAEMVGYNDIPTFRKHFVDAYGTTPSTYPNPEKVSNGMHAGYASIYPETED